ncbi:oligosaccharide amylase [Pelomyxa schiedti]|nr:oligosaccharide amylase [Pelomyxa schiedti]
MRLEVLLLAVAVVTIVGFCSCSPASLQQGHTNINIMGAAAWDHDGTTGTPLDKASWIWPEMYMYLYNDRAQFRADFFLPVTIPSPANLYITADASYKLWVNGIYIGRGPGRGFQKHWPYEVHDVSSALQPLSHNWISVEAYNPGISTFKYITQTQAGLLVGCEWGSFSLYSSQSTFSYRRSPANIPQAARLSLQMDFEEIVNGAQADRSWITSSIPPIEWVPEMYPSPAQAFLSSPFGRPPWNTLEPRMTPILIEELITPTSVSSDGSGTCGDGYREWDNISWGWNAEGSTVTQWGDGTSIISKIVDGWLQITIPATGIGHWQSITVDVGMIVVGNLIVQVDGSQGGEILDFQHDQCLRSGYPMFITPGDASWLALANRLFLNTGTTEHEFYHLLLFRHVTVIARDVETALTLKMKVRVVEYPFTLQGTFNSSDKLLSNIYVAARNTQQLCSMDTYVDTAWREQAMWFGDARIQSMNTFYLDGDTRLLQYGITLLSREFAYHGLTYGHAPTVAYNCILPDFSLTWIMTNRDLYWQTGDPTIITYQWERVKSVLSYFDTAPARGPYNLLANDNRFWLFEDWSTLYKGKIPTFLNLWYLLTLQYLGEVLTAAGMQTEAQEISEKAETHKGLVIEYLYDSEQQLFINGLDDNGIPDTGSSVHDQVLAILLGLVPEAKQVMISTKITPFLRGEYVDGATPSAFWSSYALDVMGAEGNCTDCLNFYRTNWEPMLTTNTTWEDYYWDEHSGNSATHAWTAHPSFHLVQILTGIWQSGPGWKSIKVMPTFDPTVSSASAVVPSPQGIIQAQWNKSSSQQATYQFISPAGTTAEVILPGIHEVVTGGSWYTYTITL